jgi:hypothetical protein
MMEMNDQVSSLAEAGYVSSIDILLLTYTGLDDHSLEPAS